MSNHPAWPSGLPAVAELALIGHVGGNQIINTQFYGLSAVTSDSTMAAAVDALLADWNSNVRTSFLACLPSDYVLDVIRGTPKARGGVQHLLLAAHDLTPTTSAGTNSAGGSGALEDAALLKFKTATGGRSARGRNYLLMPGATARGAGIITDSTYKNTTVPAYITALGRYRSGGAAFANFQHGIFSRPIHAGEQQWTVRVAGTLTVKSNATARAGDFNEVTSITLDTVVRDQRRRESGVGS